MQHWNINKIKIPLSLSRAITCPIPSTSQAYRRALSPEAANAYQYEVQNMNTQNMHQYIFCLGTATQMTRLSIRQNVKAENQQITHTKKKNSPQGLLAP